MNVKALCWLGVKTEKFDEMQRFLSKVMGLQQTYQERDFVVFQLPNGDKVEVFGPLGPNQHFQPDVVVCGFLVDDIRQARQELVEAGIELIGPLNDDAPGSYAWQHFRGPDGKLYELAYQPAHV